MAVLENEFLKVEIEAKGAQLTSIYNKATKTEHLWQADSKIWGWYAPNLFPIVGALIDDELLIDGEKFSMARHGFARQSEFTLLEADGKSVNFSLRYSEKTLAVYPYKFDLHILYTLIDNAVRLSYKLISLDSKTIYFSVGGHPAFNVPFHAGENFEDYYIEFEIQENLETHLLAPEGYFSGETHPVATPNKRLYLKKNLFDQDALVFKKLKSREVCIKSDKHDQSISVEYPHFNYLGLWSKGGGDFVCIEPWLGCADSGGKHVDISKKEAIQNVKPGHVFEASFYISV
jgi:galactose mutarotase-like enzyme